MADKRITDLPDLIQADSGDFIPIVDSSMNVTKKVAAEKVLPSSPVVNTGQLANGSVTLPKIDLASLVTCYKESTDFFNSGGAGAYSGAGISTALNVSFTIATEGVYEISLLLPSVYAQTTTTTYFVRAVAGSTTLFQSGTGQIARAGEPTTFFARRRMNLPAGTYNVVFNWYASVAGAGNPVNVGAAANNPATFMVKAV